MSERRGGYEDGGSIPNDGTYSVTQRKTAAGDAAANQAQEDRLDRRQAALLKVKGVGEGLKGYPDKPDPEHTIDEPYLKVNTPNEYPQSSWGHIGRRMYGGSK
jgi:hypothetical protein